MTILYMLCALHPAYGCLPLSTMEECITARDMLAPVVIVSSCEEGEYSIDIRGTIFAPMPPRKPEVKS